MNRKNALAATPPWHASPSELNGFAVQLDEIGSATESVRPLVDRLIPVDVSRRKVGFAAFEKWPTKSRCDLPTFCRNVTTGVWPAKLMSGTSASPWVLESGLPALASSKWVPLTSRDAKILLTPLTSSAQTTQGTVAWPAVIVPATTRGSSAFAFRAVVQRALVLGSLGGKAPAGVVRS